MSGQACSFWQKVLMAALSKVLVQVTEQSILRWMGACEREREAGRDWDGKVISIFRNRLLIYNSSPMIGGYLGERAHTSTCTYARLSHFYVGHVAILESILGRKMQDKNANCFTNTKVFIPWSLPVFAGANFVISCSAAWALAYFEMPRRLYFIKTQYFPKNKKHFWFSLEFATNMCILASCLGGKQNIRSHFSSAIWDLSRLNHLWFNQENINMIC